MALTRNKITFALAESMRSFGYLDVTDEMAGEILDAYCVDPGSDMPHGIVGMMLKRQLDELVESDIPLEKFTTP